MSVYLSSSQLALKTEYLFKQDAKTELSKYQNATTVDNRLKMNNFTLFFCTVSGHSERHQPESPVPSKRPSSRSETSENPLSSKRPRTAEKSSTEQVGDADNCTTHCCPQMFPKLLSLNYQPLIKGLGLTNQLKKKKVRHLKYSSDNFYLVLPPTPVL